MKPNLLSTTLISGVMLLGTFGFTACAKVALTTKNTITASDKIITKSFDIDNFKSVTAPSIVDVVYTQNAGPSIAKIEAPDNIMQYVSAEVNGSNLIVTLKDAPNINTNNKSIKCYVNSPELSEVTLSGTGDFNCTTLNTDRMFLNVSGTGDIEIDRLECTTLTATVGGTGDIEIDNLQATSVTASIGGTGDIELKGRVTNADFNIGGTGDIKAQKLIADNVNAHAGGTGDIECYAHKSINASASMTASVTYWGSPSSVQADKNVKSHK